jgi:hypothetical protein
LLMADNQETVVGEPKGVVVGEAFLVYCECGYGIQCTVRLEGERLGVLVFVDAEESSETYAEQVTQCPECGEWLGSDILARLERRRRSRRGQAEVVGKLRSGSVIRGI